jgi:hypothetical protein
LNLRQKPMGGGSAPSHIDQERCCRFHACVL